MEPGPGVFDHDLDSLPPRSGAPGRDSIALYQRLVVNPFPAVLVFVIIVAIARTGFATRSVGLFTLGVGLSLVDLFLFKYHCLDCRATGWLLRYRRHVCPGVIARWNRGELPRFCGPGVKIQLAGWLILLASVSVLGLIMLLSA